MTKQEIPESLRLGLEQSAAGDVVDLGDFTQYVARDKKALDARKNDK